MHHWVPTPAGHLDWWRDMLATSLAEPRRRGSTLAADLLGATLLPRALPLQHQLQPVPDLQPILYLHALLTYLILTP